MAAVWGALLRPVYSRGAIPEPFAGLAPGRALSTLLKRSWQASFPRWFRLRDVQYRGRVFRTAQCSSFRRDGVNVEPHVWASGAGQRENQSWPIASSFPCFSCRISHQYPRGRSREGFGGRLLESRRGEAKSGEGVSKTAGW